MVRVILLKSLVVLIVLLMRVGALLVGIVHRNGTRASPAWAPIEAGVVRLLVVLTVHASRDVGLRALGGSLGQWQRWGSKVAEEGVQDQGVGH